MNENRIKAILFDFGGVLAEEGFRNGLRELAAEQGLDTEEITEQGMRAVYDSGFVLGRGTAADFWQLLRRQTGLTGEDAALTQRILDGFVIRPWMMELVKRLRSRGYVTGILSDQTHWLDELDRRQHFSTAFTHIYNSYYLGMGKQDVAMFSAVAADLKLAPPAILFVDDDDGNVGRARQAGMQAIHYVDRNSFLSSLEGLLGKNTVPG